MIRPITSVLLSMFCLLCAVHGQERELRQWKDIRELNISQIDKQLPVYIDGTVIFSDPIRSFFVLGDGTEGIPIHVVGEFPDFGVGDRVHVTGTTMHLLQQPGVRMVSSQRLGNSEQNSDVRVKPSVFQDSDPYFKRVSVEGLISSVEEYNGEWLLGFLRNATRSHFLRIPDYVWSDFPPQRYVGQWVKMNGLYLPPDSKMTMFWGESSFGVSSSEDLNFMVDLVHAPATTWEKLTKLPITNATKPVMMEGIIEKKNAYRWVLNLEGGSIGLDWAGDSKLSGRIGRCIGFPVKRSDQFVLTPTFVFIQDQPSATASSVSPENQAWKLQQSEFLDPLTSIGDVHSLESEKASQDLLVEMDVTVTYHHPPKYVFFVQDETGGIYVHTANPFPAWLSGGTKIRLRGYTAKGFLQHNIYNAEYEILGEGDFPIAEPCDFESLMQGEFDSRYVEISGQVRDAMRVENSLQLKIQTKTSSFSAFVRNGELIDDPSIWVDTIVKLTGVSGFEYLNEKPVGVVLYVEDDTHIEELRQRPYTDLPTLEDSIDQALLARKLPDEISRVRLNGYLTGKDSSSKFTFQTKAQGFLIDPKNVDGNLVLGQFYQVMGWPSLDDGGVIIQEAVITPLEKPEELNPIGKDSAPVLNRDLLYQLVSHQGILVESTSSASRLNFVIQSSKERFATTLDISETPGLTSSSFELGSLIHVRGVLNSVPEDTSLGEVPTMVLRSKDDIEVLAPPAWWTPKRILLALGITGLVGLSAVLWGVLLKRKVNQQTDHIRQMVVKERQAEEKYHNLFESAMDLIFITDTQGRFVAVNDSCLDFLGVELHEILGESILQWIAESDVEKVKKGFGLEDGDTSTMATEGQVVEVEIRHHEGHYVFVELSIRGLALQEGVFGYQAIARNVDARKQSEQRLIQSRDSHREAHEAKTDFLTMISHDLRTPMNGVLGMTQLLLQSNLEKEQKDQLRTISSASEGVLKLMLDMLEMSHMETSQLTISTDSTDLFALVEEVATTLAAEADLKRLELVVMCQPDMHHYVQTDAGRVKQVLLNLVSNAIKFTEQGGVAIRLYQKESQEGKRLLRFEVEDSGIPLKGENRENLFEVLTKPEPNETRRFGGAGLGLTLAKRIVNAMGGMIGADPNTEGGALFWFELPLVESKIPDASTKSAFDYRPVSDKVLLVSDSRFIKEYFTHRSKHFGLSLKTLKVDEFKDALRSGKPWKGDSFNTLLVDCRLIQFEQLNSLLDQAHAFWKSSIRWGLVDTLNQAPGLLDNLPINIKPIRVVNPLSEPAFIKLWRFLSKADHATQLSETDPAVEFDHEKSKEMLKHSRLRVLVVEDDLINQKLLEIFLKKAGCIAKVVSDGEMALNRLESEPYDVVLMDCNMAGMDGLEATRHIRANEKYDNLIIIAITANVLKGYREKCFEIGMNDFLVKPLNLELLTMKLARIASRLNGQGLKN